MKIAGVIREECIELSLEGEDKFEVIKEMVEKLTEAYHLNWKTTKQILKGMIARESVMSTGLQSGVAMPHCTSELIDNVLIFIGISHRGINFEACDTKLSNIIIMVVIPTGDINLHVKTLASFARLLNKEDIRKKIISASDKQIIMDIFNTFDE
jgi:PTS system fructose-specific IIA component